jgi:hypothetical protein
MHSIFIPFKNKEVFGDFTFYVCDEIEKWLNENIGKGFKYKLKHTAKIEGHEIYLFEKSKSKWCYVIHNTESNGTLGATFHIKTTLDKIILFKLTWG